MSSGCFQNPHWPPFKAETINTPQSAFYLNGFVLDKTTSEFRKRNSCQKSKDRESGSSGKGRDQNATG